MITVLKSKTTFFNGTRYKYIPLTSKTLSRYWGYQLFEVLNMSIKGERHWNVRAVLLRTPEAVQSHQAFASFQILLSPCCQKWHGCKVGLFISSVAHSLLSMLLSLSCFIPSLHLCVFWMAFSLLSFFHALPFCVSLCPPQWVQWSGGPVYLMQCAIATLPSRAGDGRGDLAVSEVAEAG